MLLNLRSADPRSYAWLATGTIALFETSIKPNLPVLKYPA